MSNLYEPAHEAFKMPSDVDGFSVIALLRKLRTSPLVKLPEAQRQELQQDIQRVQQSCFGAGASAMSETDLRGVAEKWLVRLRDRLWLPRVLRAIQEHGLDDFDIYQLDGGLDFTREPLLPVLTTAIFTSLLRASTACSGSSPVSARASSSLAKTMSTYSVMIDSRKSRLASTTL